MGDIYFEKENLTQENQSSEEHVNNQTVSDEVQKEIKQENQWNDKMKSNSNFAHYIIEGILGLAVIALFILHFLGNKSSKDTFVPKNVAETGNGEIVFINIDTINANYELVSILTDSIEVEKQKQAVVFQNRQKSLEQKAANFERNYSSGSLTPQQAQYAQQSLQEESTRLQNDYAQALESLEIRYQTALQQIADSLNAAAQRVNANHNASYIFSYQTGSQMLYGDPAHDITDEVLHELNKSFKK